jgi:hypothetical protein
MSQEAERYGADSAVSAKEAAGSEEGLAAAKQ